MNGTEVERKGTWREHNVECVETKYYCGMQRIRKSERSRNYEGSGE